MDDTTIAADTASTRAWAEMNSNADMPNTSEAKYETPLASNCRAAAQLPRQRGEDEHGQPGQHQPDRRKRQRIPVFQHRYGERKIGRPQQHAHNAGGIADKRIAIRRGHAPGCCP
jgi:hypothetical protein